MKNLWFKLANFFLLRLSDDVPVQSDSIPLINIYFTLCMSFSLSAMIWFSLMNIYKEEKKIPRLVRIVVLKYLCCIMCAKTFNKVSTPCCANDKTSTSQKSTQENSGKLEKTFDLITVLNVKVIIEYFVFKLNKPDNWALSQAPT